MFGELLALIEGMAFRPRRTAASLAPADPLLTTLAVVLLAAASESVASLLVARATTGAASGLLYWFWNTCLDVFSLGMALLAGAVFLPFGARVVGGQGSSEDLAWALGFSYAPLLLWAGLGLAYQLTPVAALLYLVTQLGMLLWVLWIQVMALAGLYRISALRATFALALGYGAAAVLFVAFGSLGFLSLFNTLVLWTP